MKSKGAEAAAFVDESMTPAQFDAHVGRGFYWLWTGASLLRSAHVVMKQVEADSEDSANAAERSQRFGTVIPARLGDQATMLAAMAVECGLKAVIAERSGAAKNGELALKSHDLAKLAEGVITVTDSDEVDALREGKRFITWLGRFPSPMKAADFKVQWSINPRRLLAAYARIFDRLAEETARAQHSGRPELKGRTLDDHVTKIKRLVGDWLDLRAAK